MILYSILITLCVLFIVLLSIPIRIQFQSPLLCHVKWLFIKARIRQTEGDVKTEIKLFNRKTSLFKKDKQKKEEPPKKKKKKPEKKKKKRKITGSLILEILQDKATKKAVRLIPRFAFRVLKAFRITLLDCNIGLKDYYWQGIVFGIIQSLPKDENFQVKGNFMEDNDLRVGVNISLRRLFFAVILLLLRFPYLRAFLLYRKVSVQSA